MLTTKLKQKHMQMHCSFTWTIRKSHIALNIHNNKHPMWSNTECYGSKLTRVSEKIVILQHLVVESCTTWVLSPNSEFRNFCIYLWLLSKLCSIQFKTDLQKLMCIRQLRSSGSEKKRIVKYFTSTVNISNKGMTEGCYNMSAIVSTLKIFTFIKYFMFSLCHCTIW
jgi:hypothetical protein